MTTDTMTAAEYCAWLKRQPKPRGVNEESQITWSIIEYLSAVGVAAARTHAGQVELKGGGYMKLGPLGWPDITGCLPNGRMLVVETKTNDGQLSPEQRDILDWLASLGALVVIARSIDDVRAAFQREGVQTREIL